MQKQTHLPLYGVGPFYVITIGAITALAVVLRNTSFFKNGYLPSSKLLFGMIGIGCIVLGIYLWIRAVLIDQLQKSIQQDYLLTSGIYSVVRNPVYAAFLFLTSGILFMLSNIYFLILPIIYWLFLTVLMKQTEEKWLLAKYGKDYLKYCKQVNRCLPNLYELLQRIHTKSL